MELSAKNKRVNTVYSYGVFYKKSKKPAVGILVELSTDPLCLEDLGGDNGKLVASWGSRVDSISGSISGLSDVKNLENMVAEKTSYIDSDEDNEMNKIMLRRTCTWTYMLEQPLKALLFATMNDNDDNSVLPPPKISREMAVHEKIVVNGDFKKANIHSNREVIIKKIPVDLSKLAVKSVFSKFGKIVFIRMQLIGLWQKALIEFESSEIASLVASKWSVLVGKNLVCVVLAVNNKQIWMSRDCHQALLYTLPVSTSAHDLSELLVSYGGRTCFIGCNPGSYVRDWCTIICFENENAKLAACEQFGHITTSCPVGGSSGVYGKRIVSDQDQVCLASIYKKKSALIARPVLFGGKTWTQVASGISFHMSPSGSLGSGLCAGLVLPSAVSDYLVVFHLNDYLAVLEHSLELLADHVSGILVKLDSFGVIPLVLSSLATSFVISAALSFEVNSDIIVDNALSSFDITSPVTIDAVVDLSTSSSKVLTAKVGGLETKLVTLEALIATCNVRGMNICVKQTDIVYWHKGMNNMVSIVTETKLKGKICPWITNKFDGVRVFTSGLDSGHMEFGVAIILNSFLIRHVCKVSEVSGRLLLVRLLFKKKLSVFILGLYAGASSAVRFSQAGKVNSLIAKAVNESFFVVFGGDFNENGSHKCASFKKCFKLGLINSLEGSSFVKSPTWCNSCGITKMINYVLISSNLVGAVVDCGVDGVENYFNTNYKAVFVSMGLGGLLNVKLKLLHKQANKDYWKYDIKNTNEIKWSEFRDAMAANAVMFSDKFVAAKQFSNLDAM
ncbi:hypothetical protein G9A89_020460 [Geosiphon pyriformis]|nr:hypothetical protein G9A89_020460 [Geosiphon pyriformis]